MLRTRPTLSELQKKYEEAYMTCSSAVYYEGNGNEDEAMRCWKAALEQIREQRENNAALNYTPQSDTEIALVESLQELELQAQERIDLLEALRLSRLENPTTQQRGHGGSPTTEPGIPRRASGGAVTGDNLTQGWIGGGTVPAITYQDLSRPAGPPLLPPRPSASTTRTSSSDRALASAASNRKHTPSRVDTATPEDPSRPPPYVLSKKPSRSPSPEKHTLRTTLRKGTHGEKLSKSNSRDASKPSRGGFGASKAAALAWGALGFKDRSTTPTIATPPVEASASKPATPVPPIRERKQETSSTSPLHWDSHSRRLVPMRSGGSGVVGGGDPTPSQLTSRASLDSFTSNHVRVSGEYPSQRPSSFSVNAAASALALASPSPTEQLRPDRSSKAGERVSRQPKTASLTDLPDRGRREFLDPPVRRNVAGQQRLYSDSNIGGREAESRPSAVSSTSYRRNAANQRKRRDSLSSLDDTATGGSILSNPQPVAARNRRGKQAAATAEVSLLLTDSRIGSSDSAGDDDEDDIKGAGTSPAAMWKKKKAAILKNLPLGVDEEAAKQILNDIVVRGDEVHWSDVAGLEVAKMALRETVVYPFLRPDLFMGLREPATGMLLFGPPGTGKTMLARAVATESKSTFFSISASSLTSKYLGESEKLVRALFALAKMLAPSIIFVDEIDSLLSHRSGSGEHEATRRIKTEFLIQWSDLQRAAAGREDRRDKDKGKERDLRVLVLAATNLPWAIDEAARRRFARRQYIPLPEAETRRTQLRTLLGQQKHSLSDADIEKLVGLTEGFSGSDITALAKDAAMGPLRSLGEALLSMTMDEIRPIEFGDFVASLQTIRPSVSTTGLRQYEEWARQFGERGG